MNVFLRKQLLLCCLLTLASISLQAQVSSRLLKAFDGQTIRDTFESVNPPAWAITPSKGTAGFRKLSNSKYELTYTAPVGVSSIDSFRVAHFPCSLCSYLINYKVEISSSSIIANHDYTFGAKNSAVSIDVLTNDESSNGVLKLTAITLANNGTATINGNTIQFTPTSDFEGVAYFNYVVCNGNGLCDNGTVTVQVLGANATKSDTLRVFTKKNQSQVILIPNTFSIVGNPSNGTYTTAGDAPTYTPNAGFTGTDYIRFQSGNVNKWVEMVVLDAVPNTLAFDDEVYTTPAEPIEINVLANDLHKEQSGCFTIQDQPQAGTIEFDESGLVTYYPAAGFSGVDWFTYTVQAPGCAGAAETATAYVYVSNFEPAYTKFRMYTPKGTPLVIGNNVPIANFMYKVKVQGDLGRVVILEGTRDTTIQGKTISGNNIILYQPNNGVPSGIDEFELTYCVLDGLNGCAYEKSIKVEVEILNIGGNPDTKACLDDCVWPGDTNLDGEVNLEDLLPLGVGMGAVGVPRNQNTSVWFGQYGNDWNEDSNVNFKHLDTNGDSIVTALDTAAISAYYGKTHGLKASKPLFYKYNLELQGDVFINPGDVVELDLILGNEDQPITDLYGFTFPFEYSPLVFEPESVEIDFSGDNWFNYNSPTLYMTKNNGKGLIEGAITRTSGVSAKGFGEVGKVRFVTTNDLDGWRTDGEEVILEIGGGTSLTTNSAGQTIGVNVKPIQLHIIRKSEEEIQNTPLTEDLLKVYPNPTRDLLNVHLNGGQEFERVVVYSMTGQLVYNSGNMLTNRVQLNTSNLQDGMYILSVHSAKGVLNKKFEVIR
ncbi:MAG: Ig-like domain-containing protein [Saprospiraceae bacterium]